MRMAKDREVKNLTNSDYNKPPSLVLAPWSVS
jgi:hypothetical protein